MPYRKDPAVVQKALLELAETQDTLFGHLPVLGAMMNNSIEAQINELKKEDDRALFLDEYKLEEPGLNRLIRATYGLLNLITYFTAGVQEVRAWTIGRGWKAPQAASVIHTDFEKGFIKAEVYHCDDLFRCGNLAKVRESGLYRLEGKEYLVKDGDVMLFKFNV